MPLILTGHFAATLKLSELEPLVAQSEEAGALVHLTHSATETLPSYDIRIPAPKAKPIKLAKVDNGNVTLPKDAKIICSGSIWNAGSLVDAVAYRL